MLFGKRKQVVKRILIVEDEPLTAFDNENILGDAGYKIVATIDQFDDALEIIAREQVDLVLSDIRLRSQRNGIELARAAKEHGIPTLFATGHAYPGAAGIAALIALFVPMFLASERTSSVGKAPDPLNDG